MGDPQSSLIVVSILSHDSHGRMTSMTWGTPRLWKPPYAFLQNWGVKSCKILNFWPFWGNSHGESDGKTHLSSLSMVNVDPICCFSSPFRGEGNHISLRPLRVIWFPCLSVDTQIGVSNHHLVISSLARKCPIYPWESHMKKPPFLVFYLIFTRKSPIKCFNVVFPHGKVNSKTFENMVKWRQHVFFTFSQTKWEKKTISKTSKPWFSHGFPWFSHFSHGFFHAPKCRWFLGSAARATHQNLP